MNRILLCQSILLTSVLFLFSSPLSFPDAWKANHALISPAGTINLPDMPPPSEVFFSGPERSADALDEHEKYLLMSPGRDGAGIIGFRCVVDAK